MAIIAGVRIAHNATFEITDCCNCGALFAMTDEMIARRRADGKSFYCPNGHSMVFRETELQRTQRELAQLKARRDQLEASLETERSRTKAVERSRSALKGQVTKIKKKISHGECPCCNGVFRNLRRHMQRKHPEFENSEVTDDRGRTSDDTRAGD